MSTSVNRHRYKNKLLGLPHPRHGGKHGEKSAILSTKFSYILYLHRQFNAVSYTHLTLPTIYSV